jgi:exopolyphosphatase/guanosine-5'-triphosphate,3'-diphosphate pyrophosphatase
MKMDEGIYAVIDLGSNSINLAVYRMENDGMKLLAKDKNMAGILGYIDDGTISGEGIQKAAEAVEDMNQKALAIGAHVFCLATASLRGVENRQDVSNRIRSLTGLDTDVVPWEREAYYDYLAVQRLMGVGNALAIDIGGGSIELIWIRNGGLYKSAGIPTGSLRLYRDFIQGTIAEFSAIEQIEAAMNCYLDGIDWIGGTGCETLCSVGGTARAVAKLHKGLYPSPREIMDYVYQAKDLDGLHAVLADREKRNELAQRFCPDRVHTILPGFLALRSIVKKAGAQRIAVSRFGVREGYLIEKVWS